MPDVPCQKIHNQSMIANPAARPSIATEPVDMRTGNRGSLRRRSRDTVRQLSGYRFLAVPSLSSIGATGMPSLPSSVAGRWSKLVAERVIVGRIREVINSLHIGGAVEIAKLVGSCPPPNQERGGRRRLSRYSSRLIADG